MRKFTFYDSGGSQLRKTKRWLGMLSFLMLLLGTSHNTYAQDPCLISVTIEGTGWGDAITWELIDGSDQTVLMGTDYGSGYYDNQTTLAINPPYTLVITRAGICDNAPTYTVTVGGEVDVAGTLVGGCGIDTFELMDLTDCIPTCFPPMLLAVDSVTFTSADLSWESEGDLFELEYGESGFTLGEGNLVTDIEDTFYEISEGLTAETHYHYYVRRDCGDEGYSSWSGPYPFYTGYCLVSISNSSSTAYKIFGFSTSEGYTNILNPENGIANVYNNFSSYIVSTSESENFDYSVDVPGYTNVEIWVDWNNNMLFDEDELVAEHVYVTANTTFTGTITIPEGQEEGDYRMRVRSRYYFNTTATACGVTTNGETEDYTVSVVPVPDCLPPSGLAVEGISFTTAEVSWISESDTFNVVVGAPGFSPSDETAVLHEGVSNFYTIEGLDSETHYHYYVQADCSATEDGESLWAGPYPFYTGYCLVSISNSSSTAYRILGFSTLEGYTNIFNPENGIANVYNNYSNYSVAVSESESFDYSVDVQGYTNVEIWVDWNNNMI